MSPEPEPPASDFSKLQIEPRQRKPVKFSTKPLSKPAQEAAPNIMQGDQEFTQYADPTTPGIVIYAEVLLNIRTVTLFASLRTAPNVETKARLSADGKSLSVTHEGDTGTIRLPLKAKGDGNAHITIPADPKKKEIALRLQIEEEEGHDDLFGLHHSEERKANIVPWDGASLNEIKDLTVLCKSCRETILARGKVSEWRDLPNENWAEMMDFWHCHKPDEHHLHDHKHDETVAKKGYAAGARLKAATSIGFVDLSSLLLKEQDCDGVQLATDQIATPKSLACTHCKHTLGFVDESSDGWRLWKWNIDVISSTAPPRDDAPLYDQPSNTYTIQKWVSARLLFLIENQGVRKFNVHPSPSTPSSNTTSSTQPSPLPALLLWVFTPDLLFSSSISTPNRHDPTRAMKIFFEVKTWSPAKPGDPESASVEEVEFPEEVFEELRSALWRSQKVLPVNARRFQGWEVGLLERFDVGEVDGNKGSGEDRGEKGGEEVGKKGGEEVGKKEGEEVEKRVRKRTPSKLELRGSKRKDKEQEEGKKVQMGEGEEKRKRAPPKLEVRSKHQ